MDLWNGMLKFSEGKKKKPSWVKFKASKKKNCIAAANSSHCHKATSWCNFRSLMTKLKVTMVRKSVMEEAYRGTRLNIFFWVIQDNEIRNHFSSTCFTQWIWWICWEWESWYENRNIITIPAVVLRCKCTAQWLRQRLIKCELGFQFCWNFLFGKWKLPGVVVTLPVAR